MNPKNLNETNENGEIGEISPAKMMRRLLALNLKLKVIAEQLGMDEDKVKTLVADSNNSDPTNPDHQELFIFYVRQKIKSMLRVSPFLGIEKGCQKLGIDPDTYREAYSALLESGEITFEMEIPKWEGADATRALRRHIVK